MKPIVLAVLAGLCWGVGEVFTKSVLHTKLIGPLTAIAVRTTVALPLLWLAYLWIARGARAEPAGWTSAPPGVLAKLILGSGVVAGALGMICFYAALNLGEVSRVKPIAFSVAPAVGALLGILVLGESATPTKLLAIALIVAGVVLLTMSPMPAAT